MYVFLCVVFYARVETLVFMPGLCMPAHAHALEKDNSTYQHLI
jgi:hypothetical protein